MPIYEYVCTQCDKQFEELVQNSDEKVNCPACKSEQVEKQLSTFAASCNSTSSGSSSSVMTCPKTGGPG